MNEIKITIHVKLTPDTEIIGVKEDFANYCEKYGDIVNVKVERVNDSDS